MLRAGELQRVLQNLLRERVSIRDLETILETLAVHAGKTKDVDVLTEQVRQSLARQITETYRGGDGRLRVVTLARPLDARLTAAAARPTPVPPRRWAKTRPAASFAPWPSRWAPWSKRDFHLSFSHRRRARAVLKDLTRADLPRLVVLSQREIPRHAGRGSRQRHRGKARNRDDFLDHRSHWSEPSNEEVM